MVCLILESNQLRKRNSSWKSQEKRNSYYFIFFAVRSFALSGILKRTGYRGISYSWFLAQLNQQANLMGSAHAPAPIDVRVERCLKTFSRKYQFFWKNLTYSFLLIFTSVPQVKIEELWRLFNKYDRQGSGYMVGKLSA